MNKFAKQTVLNAVLLVFLSLFAFSVNAQTVSTDPNFKVAFIGDAGLGTNFTNVLNLIKNEGAQAVLHQGDFDYTFNPSAFYAKVDSVLGGNFPYFTSVGNHDDESWNTGCVDPDGCYGQFQKDRLARIGVTPDNPDLNDHMYSAVFKGLKMVFVGQSGVTAGNNTYAPFIQSQLQSDNHTWRVCSWHKNQGTMNVGAKPDEMGWNVYETCRNQGAIIATAHEHTYHRTKTLTNMQALTVDTTQHPLSGGVPGNPNTVLVSPGKSFVFVSGLGGQGARNQNKCTPTTYPYSGGVGCNYIWASIYTTDQGAGYGALFITFNVDGNPNKARGYFKNTSGQIIDQFDIIKSATAATVAPTQPNSSPTRTRTPVPGQPSPTRTRTPVPGQPTNTPNPQVSPTTVPGGVCTYFRS